MFLMHAISMGIMQESLTGYDHALLSARAHRFGGPSSVHNFIAKASDVNSKTTTCTFTKRIRIEDGEFANLLASSVNIPLKNK